MIERNELYQPWCHQRDAKILREWYEEREYALDLFNKLKGIWGEDSEIPKMIINMSQRSYFDESRETYKNYLNGSASPTFMDWSPLSIEDTFRRGHDGC